MQGIFNVGCAWVTDGQRESHGFSSAFAYPPGCLEAAYVEQEPIGDLFDDLWRRNRDGEPAFAAKAVGEAGRTGRGEPGHPPPADVEPSGRRGGNIGMLTQGRLDRSAYGEQAVICALVAFLHTDLYD
jgi:non-canonical (house-cleaning) NTP pyrophosphatase